MSHWMFRYLTISLLVLTINLSMTDSLPAQNQTNKDFPSVLSFDGLMLDTKGNVLSDGHYNFKFSLYTEPAGGEPVWTEVQNGLYVENGKVSLLLGNGTKRNQINIPFDRQYYLGVQINSDEEVPQRIELLTSPFSIRTKVAESVPDASITTSKIAPLSVTDEKIESISWDKITNVPDLKNEFTLKKKSNSTTAVRTYWRRHGNYLKTGDEFIGTINDRNLIIKTDSIQRMLFDPYGKVLLGTVEDSVDFEVIGKTTLVDAYFKGKVGVGVDPALAKLHVNSETRDPFRIDYQSSRKFEIEKNGRVTIESNLSGAEDDLDNYPLYINAIDNGIAIRIDGGADGDNNYVSFWDDAGMAGRIEGQTELEYLADPVNIAHDVWLVAQGVAVGVASAAGPLEIPDIAKLAAEILYFTFETTWSLTHTGVTYESSSGDYAEWLMKKNPDDNFMPGDIVGVSGGKISKSTKMADQIMSISLSPVVLGNMPKDADELKYEKVAFKGQVPVKVIGLVSKGDYIIPSGFEDGTGIAIPPELMTVEEFSKSVGTAWESSDLTSLKFVNVAVGMSWNKIVSAIKKNDVRINKITSAIEIKDAELNYTLNEIDKIKNNVTLLNGKIEYLKKVIKNENPVSAVINFKQTKK